MKKIFSIILIAACGLFAYSCANEADTDFSGRMTVSLNTGDLQLTKASSEDPFNENLIKSIDFFLYKGNDTTVAFQHGHLSTEAIHSKTFIIDFKLSDYNTLFASSDNAVMYAVVNMPENTALSGTGIDDVRAATLTADFATDSIMGWFVMSGRTVFPKNATDISVEVERVAAKLSLGITTVEYSLEDEADPTSTKWYSHPEAIKIEFVNTFSKAVVSGKIDAYTATDETVATVPESKPHTYYYTYPRQWEFGSDFEPYFFITMPVTKDSFEGDGSPSKYCYYKVVLPGKQFERNHWYAYTIRLKMLGSFERETPTVDTPDNVNFFVHKWGGYSEALGNNTTGQIEGIRYLEVSDNSADKIYYMYNQEVLKIPFASSDVCRIINKTATTQNFSNASSVTTTNIASEVTVTIVGEEIVINHPLNNNVAPGQDFDYSPVTIEFDIQHNTGSSSDALYTEHIRITQYPAMYIQVQRSTPYPGNDDRPRYLFVNNNSSATKYWNTVEGVDETSNNKNMYIINVSRFDTDDFIIGDPRTDTVRNATQIGFNKPSVQNDVNGHSLTYYYGTQSDDAKANVVAPKYRICSAYGQLGSNKLTIQQAYFRCAAYQEEGRPAGRWRLPTAGELRFIATLCATGKIPPLFSSGMTYWCASGAFKYSSSGSGSVTPTTWSNSSTYFSRCVYDEWYWENTENGGVLTDMSRFTWGDVQR